MRLILFTDILKKALEKASTKQSSSRVKLDGPVVLSTCAACGMYLTALNTLTELKLDILAGIVYGWTGGMRGHVKYGGITSEKLRI